MKKVIAVLIVVVVSCMSLTAMKGSSVFSVGYTADTRTSSSGEKYTYFGPNIGLSTIRANGESSSVGFYSHLTMTLVTRQFTTSREWVKIDLSKRLNILTHELGGIGFLIPISSTFDIILGAGLSVDLDIYSSSSFFLLEEVFGLGIGADLRLRLTESLCVNFSAQSSYSIWGEDIYLSDSYSDVFTIDFSERRRYSGVKAKIGLGFGF